MPNTQQPPPLDGEQREERGGASPGEERLRAALHRRRQAAAARTADPKPYDDDWGWWIEKRLATLEARTKWLVGLAAGALAAEVIRLALAALGL